MNNFGMHDSSKNAYNGTAFLSVTASIFSLTVSILSLTVSILCLLHFIILAFYLLYFIILAFYFFIKNAQSISSIGRDVQLDKAFVSLSPNIFSSSLWIF